MTDRREGRRLVILSRHGRDQHLARYGPFQGSPGQPRGPADGDWQVSPPSKEPDKTPYLIPIPIGLILCLVINLVRACASDTGPSYPQPAGNIVIESPGDYSNFRRGTQAYFLGEYDKAITYFTMALESEPNMGEIYNRRALAYHGKGEYDRALADYEQAFNHQSDPAMVHNNRAVTYLAMGDLDKAMADLGQAIELDASFGKAYYNRGLVHASQGGYDAAIADLTEALRFPAATSPLSRMLAQRSTSPALGLMLGTEEMERELAETGADEPSVRYYRATAYQAKEEYDRALQDLDKAIEILSETVPEASPLRPGQESTTLGEATAVPQEEASPEDPRVDLPSVYYLRALVYAEKGEYNQATVDLDRALGRGLDPGLGKELRALLTALDAWDTPWDQEYADSPSPQPDGPAASVEPGSGPEGGQVLAVDVKTPGTLYVGTYHGIVKSTDGGQTWSAANIGMADCIVSALVVDPVTPATLYAATLGPDAARADIVKSTDGGESWVTVSTGLTAGYVESLAIDPRTPTTLYAGISGGFGGTGGGVFKSVDGGLHWTAGNAGSLSGDVYVGTLAIDPSDPFTIYAATDRGLCKSIDGGRNWNVIISGLSTSRVYTLAIDPFTPGTLYVATSGGLYKGSNGGQLWTVADRGLPDSTVQALAIGPARPTTLYAGTERGGVFKSTDGGMNWSAVSTDQAIASVQALAVDPFSPTTLYLVGSAGVYVIHQLDGP